MPKMYGYLTLFGGTGVAQSEMKLCFTAPWRRKMKKRIIGLCWMLMLVILCGTASAAVNLKKGSTSWDVFFAEERLTQLGYNPGAADGLYEAETVEAVKAFQRDRGLKETGTVKEETWDALFSETYQLRYDAGMGARDYLIRGKMPSRFAKIGITGTRSGAEDMADFSSLSDTTKLRVWLFVRSESMDEIIAGLRTNEQDVFDNQFASTAYEGKDFKAGKAKSRKINGKPAQTWLTTWNFTNGGKLTHYWYYGVMELDPVGEYQAYAVVSLVYNIDSQGKAMDKALGQDAVLEALENIRCDRDRLYEYQAGAAKRLKTSKLKKFTLPEFQPVDETEQGALDIIYEIWHHVDPAADGTQEEITGETCVSMYYGAKIMDRFMFFVNHGNSRENARAECVMSLANSVFYDDFRAARPEIREKLAAAMSAARLALDEDNKAYLTLLGLEKPEWTEEDLANMTRSLIGAMDSLIGDKKQTEEPTKEPATPAPTEVPTTPKPTEEPATPAPTEVPATPDPTEVPVPSESAEGSEHGPESGDFAKEEKWICPNCGEEVTSPFCSNCGSPSPAPAPTEEPASADSGLKAGADSSGEESLLRFDGLYQYIDYEGESILWLKFYPEGKVTDVATVFTSADMVGKWIDETDSSGQYTIDGNHIEFDTKREDGVISYRGTIQNASVLVLDIDSHINGHTSQGVIFTFSGY